MSAALDQYSYTQDESIELLIHSVKGNQVCKDERKQFNLCRATILGKFVEPNYCQEKSFALINCFQKVRQVNSAECKTSFDKVLTCAQNNQGGFFTFGSACQNDLESYLSCKQ